MRKLRVLLADDHQVVRQGLQLLVNSQTDMVVVGEASNGEEAIQQAGNLRPDVVVIDLSMPKLNGLQATQLLRAKHADVKVVALTVHEDESYLRQVCKAGAAGYVLKRSAGEDLIQAIRTVAGGGVHYDATLASKALAVQAVGSASKAAAHSSILSQREREALILVAWGFSNKEIAGKMGLSVKTVETYKVRVAEKLRLRSRVEMVRYALRQGWLNDSDSSL